MTKAFLIKPLVFRTIIKLFLIVAPGTPSRYLFKTKWELVYWAFLLCRYTLFTACKWCGRSKSIFSAKKDRNQNNCVPQWSLRYADEQSFISGGPLSGRQLWCELSWPQQGCGPFLCPSLEWYSSPISMSKGLTEINSIHGLELAVVLSGASSNRSGRRGTSQIWLKSWDRAHSSNVLVNPLPVSTQPLRLWRIGSSGIHDRTNSCTSVVSLRSPLKNGGKTLMTRWWCPRQTLALRVSGFATSTVAGICWSI